MLRRLLILALFLLPLVESMDSTYDVILEENGQAAILIQIEGKGLIALPIQRDADSIRVKGALYRIDNTTMEVSIGSTERAAILYKTALLTDKDEDTWVLRLPMVRNNETTVTLPSNAEIISTVPNAFIQEGNVNKVIFRNTDAVEISYRFTEAKKDNYLPFVLTAVIVLILAISILALWKRPKAAEKKVSNKDKILKTLSENERVVVKMLIEEGEMKRSDLEKKTRMAKSSLANTLNNLEKKNIIELDKTYTSHFIRFTGWFNEL